MTDRAEKILDLSPGYTRAQNIPLDQLVWGAMSHKEVANMVRMLTRSDLGHEGVCLAARDRIAWLAKRVEEMQAVCQRIVDAVEDGDEMTAVSMARAAIEKLNA